MRVYLDGAPIVGRAVEAEQLEQALRDAASGRPSAVLVHGEPGIGKTRLVSDLCVRERRAGTAVLWGQCVRFGATQAPYLPLLSAFEDWRDGRERPHAPAEVEDLLAALSGESTAQVSMRLIRMFDAALAATSGGELRVLVVDDLQWADQSTLDVLAYLLATARTPQVALLMTYRDTELGEGHPLHGWLGDAKGLPGVRDLPLGRLGREQMETLARAAGGRQAPMRLVDEVLARSCGNPYLSELLLRNVPEGSDHLPDGLPDGLRAALLAAWHRTGAESRAVTRLLATAQKPLGEADLAAVAAAAGIATVAALGPAVEEAAAAGILVRERDGLLWFHHPLMAEVLYEDLTTAQRIRLHHAFVVSLERNAAGDPRVAAHLALHSERAGLTDRAFTYALRAADHAASMSAFPEEAEQLRRAAQLWPDVSPEVSSGVRPHARLWCDTAEVAARVGWGDVAADAIDAARAVTDPVADPVTAARVLRLWGGYQRMAGRLSGFPVDQLHEAVRISTGCGDAEERASCLAVLATWEWWDGDIENARLHVDHGVDIAMACGSSSALASALAARSAIRPPGEGALADAEESERLAIELDDVDLIVDSSIAHADALQGLHRFGERADAFDRGYRLATQRGFGRQQQKLATYAAHNLMDACRYDEARGMLREALAVPSTVAGGLQARLASTYLELMMGNIDAADRHLARALELAPDLVRSHSMGAPTTLAVHHMVTGSWEKAVLLLDESLRRDTSGDASYADWTVLTAALATGEMYAGAREIRDHAAATRTREVFARLLTRRRDRGGEPFPATDPVAKAHRTLLHAEIARAFAHDDERRRWWELEYVSDHSGEGWVMTLGILHWAEALVLSGASRAEIAVPLRRAHGRAREFGFTLLRERTESLGRRLRVTLDGAEPEVPADSLGVLTPREREVLELLAAGRTYADISRELFISQKTVSVHVSHLLQKTGTSSRGEAAAWAWRNGVLTHE